jgi:hypothetical protein
MYRAKKICTRKYKIVNACYGIHEFHAYSTQYLKKKTEKEKKILGSHKQGRCWKIAQRDNVSSNLLLPPRTRNYARLQNRLQY